MRLKLHILGSIALMGALALPAAMVAQDRDHDDNRARQADRDHDRNKDKVHRDRDEQGRYYDPYRRDYHAWDTNEQAAYSQYAQEHRWQNREYSQLSNRQRNQYWKWRHQRMKRDKDRDHDNDRH